MKTHYKKKKKGFSIDYLGEDIITLGIDLINIGFFYLR